MHRSWPNQGADNEKPLSPGGGGSGRRARDLPNFRYQCSSPTVSRMSWSRLSIALRLLEQHQTRSWFSTQTPGTRSYSSTPKSSVKKYWHS